MGQHVVWRLIFSLCKNKFDMAILYMVGIYGETIPTCFSVVPNETFFANSTRGKDMW